MSVLRLDRNPPLSFGGNTLLKRAVHKLSCAALLPPLPGAAEQGARIHMRAGVRVLGLTLARAYVTQLC